MLRSRGNGGYESVYTRSFWNMFGGHNCTNYIAYRLSQRGIVSSHGSPGNGDAEELQGHQARAKGYAVDKSESSTGDVAGSIRTIGTSWPRGLCGECGRRQSHCLRGQLGWELPLAPVLHQGRHRIHPIHR